MVTITELIFWIFALIIAIAFVGGCVYWSRKPIELDHDPHADDFNKDIWED